MTVFRGYIKVIKSNRLMICFYLAIFFAFSILFQTTAKSADTEMYQMRGVRIGVINNDDGALAEALVRYLSGIHQVTELDDEISVLQEKLYYRAADYIVRIPEDFYEKCISEGKELEVTMIPGSYTGIYVDQQINSFLNNAAVYQKAGFTEEETADAMKNRENVRVELADDKSVSGDNKVYIYYFRYMPYLYLAVFGFVLGDILWSFQKKELNRRMMASPVPLRRQKLEGMLCMILFGTGIWALLILGAAVCYGKSWTGSGNAGYYILNTLALLFCTLSVAFLAGTISPNRAALTGIVNILSLGMCFLGGTFVSLDVMSSSIKKISQFLPVYWYEKANDILTDFSMMTETARNQVLQAVGIQIVFGVAFFCLAVTAARYKQTEW